MANATERSAGSVRVAAVLGCFIYPGTGSGRFDRRQDRAVRHRDTENEGQVSVR